jgi:non-specific serine/threonine protein kinase
LRKLIYPFILRRTKEQVALELPPRTERIVYTDMASAQKKLYTQTRERYRAELLGLIEREGINDVRFKDPGRLAEIAPDRHSSCTGR